jgi:guanylate kinase
MSASERRRGILFVVAAPSGTGKTSVCRRIVEADHEIVFSVSHTTRRRRTNEVDGEDYHFTTPEDFQRMIDSDAFLEWAVYNGNHYGTSWTTIEEPLAAGRDVLLEIEVQGAQQVRKRRRDACFIFLLPPSMEALLARLTGRGTDSPEEIRRRLDWARVELGQIETFDYAIFNDDLDSCIAAVAEVIAAERIGAVGELRRRHAVLPALVKFRAGAPPGA